MKTIPLTQGKVAIVDDEEFKRINQFKWYAHEEPKGSGRWYAIRNTKGVEPRTAIKMHREVMGLKPGDPHLDHRDRDGLNNRRENLRLADDSKNNMNKKGWSKIGLKGVRFRPGRGKPYEARIGLSGKVFLGTFKTAEEAARAYNQKALELFGEFARLNPV